MKNKIALVTGASSGIGQAIAELLSRSGYTVYGTSRKGSSSEQRNYKMIALDVNNEASTQAALKEVIQAEGRIDVVVNNAGFGVEAGGAEESSIAQMQQMFDTNFFGVVRVIQAVLPYMRKQKQGRIINIGSMLGLLPAPYMATYSASTIVATGPIALINAALRLPS